MNRRLPLIQGTDFFIGRRRAMVSLGPVNSIPCKYKCAFCYTTVGFPSYPKLGAAEIVDRLQARRKDFDIVYISGDTDSFAQPRASAAIDLLESLTTLRCDVMFTTREVLGSAELVRLEELVERFRDDDRNLIACVSISQIGFPELEPRVGSPKERADFLQKLRSMGMITALTIRPFLPHLPASEYVEIAQQFGECADLIITGDWWADLDGKLLEQVNSCLGCEPAFGPTITEPLYFSTDATRLYAKYVHTEARERVSQYAHSHGIPHFHGSEDACDYIRASLGRAAGSRTHPARSHTPVSDLLDEASDILFGSIGVLRSSITDTPTLQPPRPESSIQILEDVIAKAKSDVFRVDSAADEESDDGAVDPGDPEFQSAFVLEQRKIKGLLEEDAALVTRQSAPELWDLCDQSMEYLQREFGSISNAWDTMVHVRMIQTNAPAARRAVGLWVIDLMNEFERILRQGIAVCFLNLGPTVLKDSFGEAFRCLDISLQPERLLDQQSSKQVVVQEVLDAMRKSSRLTLKVGEIVSSAVDAPFLPDVPGLNPGLLDKLTWLASRVVGASDFSRNRRTIDHLLDVRRHIIHISVGTDRERFGYESLEPFLRHEPGDLGLLAEFVIAAAIDSTLAMIFGARDLARLDGLGHPMDLEHERMLASEMRVIQMEMLRLKHFGLAWTLGRHMQRLSPDVSMAMPELNTLFARMQMRLAVDRESLERDLTGFHAENARHRLIHRTLLGQFDGIAQVLDEAVNLTGMTPAEIETWPALEGLRSRPEYADWRSGRFVGN